MNPHIREYHVIIVHYGSLKSTQRLVNTLLQGKQPPDMVVVVNHDKHSLQKLVSRKCRVVKPGSNQGYAAGINVGLGVLMARGASVNDIVTCINNDIAIKPESFSLVRRWWENNPEPALVEFVTSQNKIERVYSYVNLFTGRSYLSPFLKRSDVFHMHYIQGVFMAAPFEIFADSHGMPEKYFMYWEDVLFSKQVAKKGFSLKVASGVMAIHRSDAEPVVDDDKLYYLVRNGALFLEQDTPLLWRGYWFVVNRLRYIYHAVNRSKKPVVAEAMKDAVYGVTGKKLNEKRESS